MAILKFNEETYVVDHAVKGPDYVHGYDATGNLIINIEGISDFSIVAYDSTYLLPEDCAAESCNEIVSVGGRIQRRDGGTIGRITGLPLPESGSEPATKEFVENFTVEGSTYVATDDNKDGHIVLRPYVADADELEFRDHIKNKNNPHGVTIEQIGAAPAGLIDGTIWPQSYDLFETSIADIYTQMPNSATRHFVVNDHIGLPYLGGGIWFAELSKMVEGYCTLKMRSYLTNSIRELSRSMFNGVWGDWIDVSPSAFAPAGYGYGEALISIGGTYSEVTAALDGILANMKSGETKQLGVGIAGQIYQNAAILYKYSSTHAGLTTLSEVIHEDPIAAGTWRMVKNSNVWLEIEWVNPPMVPGVEYRTTERYNGKAVYTKLIDFGALPNNTEKTVAPSIYPMGLPLSVTVVAKKDSWSFTLPSGYSEETKVLFSPSGVTIKTTLDRSDYTAYATVKYTKD